MPTGVRGYRFCGETIVSSIDLPLLQRAGGADPACRIERAAAGDGTADAQWFHHWRIGRQAWLSFARRDEGYLLRFPDLAEFLVSGDGGRIGACASPSLPEDTLGHLLMDQVLPLALSRRGRTL